MFDVSYPVAFWAGVVSFFAPCVVPLLPSYISYITGTSLPELKAKGYLEFRKKLIISSLFYILGFSAVFVMLGGAAGGLGILLRRYDSVIQKAGGLIILVLGLQFAGILNIPFLSYQKQFKLPSWTKKIGNLRAFVIGVIFASAWTPCIGPVLGSILALAAVSGTAIKGASLLFTYSLGISIPFLLFSLTLASVPKYLSFITKHIGVISRLSGILLAILGTLLLTDTYKYLNAWLIEVAMKLGYEIQ